jgi:hypothetical protein
MLEPAQTERTERPGWNETQVDIFGRSGDVALQRRLPRPANRQPKLEVANADRQKPLQTDEATYRRRVR